jgi:hypothetical protein
MPPLYANQMATKINVVITGLKRFKYIERSIRKKAEQTVIRVKIQGSVLLRRPQTCLIKKAG